MLLVIYYSVKICNLLINLFLSDDKGNGGCIGLGILGTIKFIHVNYWLEKVSLMQNIHSSVLMILFG